MKNIFLKKHQLEPYHPSLPYSSFEANWIHMTPIATENFTITTFIYLCRPI